MPARFLLIDGYNLLHAAGMGRREYGPGDLQRCRERLLRYLATKLRPAEIDRTTVIFDARDPPPDRPSQQVFRGLTVLFANPGGDADVVIQNWLNDHSSPKRVTLVSSDHVLQRAARRRRAEFIDSEAFFDQLERRRSRTKAPDAGEGDAHDAKPVDRPSALELAQWLQVFGNFVAPDTPESAAACDATRGERPIEPHGEAREQLSAKRRSAKSEKSDDKQRRMRLSTDDVTLLAEMFGHLPGSERLAQGIPVSQAELERWLAERGDCRIDLPLRRKKDENSRER